jgi:hypothetical protein
MEDCFIICPLSNEDSEIRKRTDLLQKHILEPVLTKSEYNLIRADQHPKGGIITTQIINLIIDSPLVIADLTGSNPNVFYELAIRHASGEPYIQLIQKGEKIPFDIAGIRTIEINLKDLDNVEESKIKIEKQIQEIKNGHNPDSPITVATNTKLIQNDEEFAEKIAGNLQMFIDGASGMYYDDTVYSHEELEYINSKLHFLSRYGSVTFEDLDKKIDELLDKVSQIIK